MSKKLTHVEYTVGWICPLEVEQIAALEMLDETHERLPQAPTDHNVYNLGNIAGHNIVITGLFRTGNNPAATVVTQMRTTFPNLRFGLLVGIGGGVPVKTDYGMIRLGDVVVSKPVGKSSGALQYDHGKAKVGLFENTGSLAPPPAVLLNAAQNLQAKRARSRVDPLEENIKRIDTSIPGLRRYKHPDPAHDYLYPSDYIHKKPGLSCADCGCDPLQRIQQTVDGYDEPCIVVHRGTIASGELVIKDAVLRDTLANEHGVLCFEMEAAGSLADFPCLVIRGISDYCDSHKNDQWHGYAAAAAAAYARELFFHMPIDEVRRYISETAEDDIHFVKLQQAEQRCQTVLDWLAPVRNDYGPRQSDFIKMRQPGSGKWLLESKEYQRWLNADEQTLFCPGMPGAGKTILTAIVVDDLAKRFTSDANVGMAYIYCNFRQHDAQKIDHLMASLLKQLAHSQSPLPASIECLYNQHMKMRTRPSFDEILQTIQNVATTYMRLFIVVDALDELQISDGTRTRFLRELSNLQTLHGVNIFATSRFIPQIIDQFNDSMSLEIRAHAEDVQRYLHSRIVQSESKVLRTCCEDITTGIAKAIDGMFLLARLYFDSIKSKTTVKKIKETLRNLPRGSEAYNYAYSDAMERIKAQDADFQELAENVLSWIVHAKRPLYKAELQHALAVEVGEPTLDEENLPDTEDMISVCAGLVIVDEESDIIRLVHYTAQEYFERTWKSWFPDSQTYITKVCVTYLAFDTFEAGFCESDEELYQRLESNVLYDYAAQFWGHHAYTASEEIEDLILSFLRNEVKVSSCFQAMVFDRLSPYVPERISGLHLAAWLGLTKLVSALLGNGYGPDIMDDGDRTPLSYAAENGHERVVQLLLNRGADINAKGSGPDSGGGNRYYNYSDQTPLMYASRNGQEAVVRLLLISGTDVVAKGLSDYNSDSFFHDQTALIYAVKGGHEAVVRLLLNGGADVDAEEGCHAGDSVWFSEYQAQTALMYAAMNGHETIVRLLIDGHANVNALERGRSNGFGCHDAEGRSYNRRSALMYAAMNAHDAVVRILLYNGANINEEESGGINEHRRYRSLHGLTALMYAAGKGSDLVVRLLLCHGADVNAKEKGHDCYRSDGCDSRSSYNYDGRTALIYAASKGHERVVRLLLDAGADVTAKEKGLYDWEEQKEKNKNVNDCGRTALTYAAMNGHKEVVKLLLAQDGVDMNTKDLAGRTPLSYAAVNGQTEVMKLLSESGASET